MDYKGPLPAAAALCIRPAGLRIDASAKCVGARRISRRSGGVSEWKLGPNSLLHSLFASSVTLTRLDKSHTSFRVHHDDYARVSAASGPPASVGLQRPILARRAGEHHHGTNANGSCPG